MCSFLVTNKKIENLEKVNYFLKNRGPDCTNIVNYNNINFLHNLLHITGKKTIQPVFKNNVCLVFNGEIYNYKEQYEGESEYILNCYLEEKQHFYKHLDGEYALVIVDFNKQKIFFSGDIFLTKPIYYSLENKTFGICSYESGLKNIDFKTILRLKPNSYYILDMKTFELTVKNIHEFDLSQTIDTFELWNLAFENALIKRTLSENKIIVPLSSGHDSGTIICGIEKLNIHNYQTCSYKKNENKDILQQRLKLVKNKLVVNNISGKKYIQTKQKILNNIEPFFYGYNFKSKKINGFNDDATVGLYYLLEQSKKRFNIKIQISGQGGDEIYSNNQQYGFENRFNPKVFPENLNIIFPYANFYEGGNYSYLTKEEHVAGGLGIETRYPFLDKNVVQQFLNLTPKLKNKYYKSPLTNYMEQNNFPYFQGKAGFKINKYNSKYLNSVSKYTNIELI